MSFLDERTVTPPQIEDQRLFQQLVGRVDLESGNTHKLEVDGLSVDVSKEIAGAVLDLLARLGRGQAVLIGSLDELLTTSQVGELLGVSRTYVTQLVDRGDIPFEFRGTHRRIRLQDALNYGEVATLKRAHHLDELARLARESGAYEGDDF